jgi:hypothetical protein
MKISSTIFALMAALAFTAPALPAQAATNFGVTFSGASAVPANPSTGFGTALISISDPLDSLSFSSVFLGLSSGTTQGGIHCCALPGFTSGAAINLSGLPLGVTSGGFSQMFNLLSNTTYTSGFLAANGGSATTARNTLVSALLSGTSYVSIHTSNYQSGEIRGQATLVPSAVPEPQQWALMLIGMFGTAAMLRRQRNGRRLVRSVRA